MKTLEVMEDGDAIYVTFLPLQDFVTRILDTVGSDSICTLPLPIRRYRNNSWNILEYSNGFARTFLSMEEPFPYGLRSTDSPTKRIIKPAPTGTRISAGFPSKTGYTPFHKGRRIFHG